jgi:hypothetical protein
MKKLHPSDRPVNDKFPSKKFIIIFTRSLFCGGEYPHLFFAPPPHEFKEPESPFATGSFGQGEKRLIAIIRVLAKYRTTEMKTL